MDVRTITPALVVASVVAGPRPARADDPPLAIGARVGALHALAIGGSTGAIVPDDQGLAFAAGVYADWRVQRYLALGLELPAIVNGVGPTANERDVGIGPRVRASYPASAQLEPFLSVTPSLRFAWLPQGVWWTGHALDLAVGVRARATTRFAVSFALRATFASYAGEVTLPLETATSHGDVRTAYIGADVAVELGL